MSKPTEPKTNPQRRAVDLLRSHGRVYVAGRGRYANIGADVPVNQVSGQMSVWLQRAGWAEWKLAGLAFLAIIHQDTHQTYEPESDALNAFVTHCTCGHTTRGMDPDDADAAMLAHTNPESAA